MSGRQGHTPPRRSTARLFVALWPEQTVRDRLGQWGRSLHGFSGGRLMPVENLHVTVAFLGDVALDRVDALQDAVRRTGPVAMACRLDTAGYWPRNRIVWAGAQETPGDLHERVLALRSNLHAAGFASDGKPFVLHVTLIRDARPIERWPALDPLEWRLDRFVLVRSDLSRGGSRYCIVAPRSR